MGYEGLLTILQMNAEEYEQALAQEELEPLSCRECGLPLDAGPDGRPFCRADGWRPPV
jgi:hypothetical protein